MIGSMEAHLNPDIGTDAILLLGYLIGHRFELHRAKRKEYVELVAPIRARLVSGRDSPSAMLYPQITAAELDALDYYHSRWRRGRLRAAMKRYDESRTAQEYQDEYGQPHFRDPAAVSAAAAALLGLLRRP